MTHEEEVAMLNAIAGALGHYAWRPEVVFAQAIDKLPEMSMSMLRMVKRLLLASEWHMGCEYSRRKCMQNVRGLLAGASRRIKEIEMERENDETEQDQGAV